MHGSDHRRNFRTCRCVYVFEAGFKFICVIPGWLMVQEMAAAHASAILTADRIAERIISQQGIQVVTISSS